MKYYICDRCGEKIHGDPLVTITGVSESKGGILLSERFRKKHFYCPLCLYQWAEENKPEHTKPQPTETAQKSDLGDLSSVYTRND